MVGAARPVWWSKMREVMCAETCDKSTAPADRLRAASVRLPRHRSSSAPQSTPALTRTPAAGPRVAGTCAASLRPSRSRAAARSTGGGANLIFIAVTCSGARTFTLHVDTREAATADDAYRAAYSAWRRPATGVVPPRGARRRCRAVHRFDPSDFRVRSPRAGFAGSSLSAPHAICACM